MAEFGSLSGSRKDPTQARPLRLVHNPLWKGERASGRLAGSRVKGGGQHSNTMHLSTSLFLPGIRVWWGLLFHLGAFHFLTWLQGLQSPQKSPAKGAEGAGSAPARTGSDINLLSVCSIGRSPSSHHPSCCFLNSICFMTSHLFDA